MLNTASLVGFTGIIVLAITTAAWFFRASRVAIPDNRLMFLLGWARGGLLGAIGILSHGANWLSAIFGGLSLVVGVFFLGLYVLRKQGVGNPILVGDTVPSFEAINDLGETYSSEALIGTPTLVKFFRGHW